MAKRPSPRPLSIKVLAVYYLYASVAFTVTMLTAPASAVLCGRYVSGALAVLHNSVVPIVWLLLGLGLWRLVEVARRVAMGWEAYLLLNALVTFLIPASRTIAIEKVIEQTSQAELDRSTATVTMLGVMAVTALLTAVRLWFLVKRRAAFMRLLPPVEAEQVPRST